MDLFSLIGFTAAAAIISMTVRSFSPQIGRQTAIAAAVLAMLTLVASVSGIMTEVERLAALGGVGGETVGFVFKAVGIAYITRTAAAICSDMDEAALAQTAELAGRLMLAVITLPIVRRIAEYLINLIETAI